MVFYSEFDRGAAEWVRELGRCGHIPAGVVDERDIREVPADDLRGHHAVHLFAGIGGWAYALRLAGWPDDRPVWTGSCPCQPFSQAGKRKGESDARHLWPEFLRLITECRPATIFGEQVASKDGRAWLARVRTDLEALGYAVGCADLCAAGVGSPHIRQRLYWVADSGHLRRAARLQGSFEQPGAPEREGAGSRGTDGGLADNAGAGRDERRAGEEGDGGAEEPERLRVARGVGDPDCGRREEPDASVRVPRNAGEYVPAGFWSAFDLVPCRDGKQRRVEPGTFPLAHGVPGRVGLLRGFGNAIVPQVAAEFVRAFLEAEEELRG